MIHICLWPSGLRTFPPFISRGSGWGPSLKLHWVSDLIPGQKKLWFTYLLLCAVTTVSPFCHCKCTHSQIEWWVCCDYKLNNSLVLFIIVFLFYSWTSVHHFGQSSFSWWEFGCSPVLSILRYGDFPFFFLTHSTTYSKLLIALHLQTVIFNYFSSATWFSLLILL